MMIDMEHYQDKPQAYILEEVQKLSKKIVKQQKQADTEGFKTYGGALGIQTLRQDRKTLQGLLNRPKLASVDGEAV
jgi:hypothetical protein